MKLRLADFTGKFDNYVLVTEKEVNLDVETALRTIKDEKIKDRLYKALKAVNEAVSNVKRDETLKGAQLEIDRCDYIMNKQYSEDGQENLYISRLACNILRKGKKAYNFKQLDIVELVFKLKGTDKISLLSRQYKQVPNGYDEDGNITITKTVSIDTLIHTFDFSKDLEQEIYINDTSLRALITNPQHLSIIDKFDTLKLDETDNIKMIEKHSGKDLKKSIKYIIETVQSEFDALDELKELKFNYANYKPYDEQKTSING